MSSSNAPSANLAPAASQSNPAFNTSTGPSTLSVTTTQHPTKVTVPLVATLSSTMNHKTFDPRSNPGLISMMSMFESVHLDDIAFTVIITPGLTRKVLWAVNDGTALTNITEFMTSPVAGLVPGAQYGSVVEQVVYPSTSFGLEIKALNLGNASPVFHFLYEGGTPASTSADVIIRGHITLTYSGFGIVNAVAF